MLLSLAMALFGRATALFPLQSGNSQSIVLPFDSSADSDWAIVYKIGINGKGPFPCFFDTGASAFALDQKLTKELNIVEQEGLDVNGQGGQIMQSKKILVNTIELDHASFQNNQAVSLQLPQWFPCRCILGAPLLWLGVVRLDFDKKQLTMMQPDTFEYTGFGSTIPLTFCDQFVPVVDCELDGVPGKFMLDTGDADTITVNSAFVAKHHLQDSYKHGINEFKSDITGRSKTITVRAKSLKIGQYTLNKPVATLLTNAKGDFPGADGIIGIRVLRRFNFVLDLRKSRGYFEPRSIFQEPFPHRGTGIGITSSEKGMVVAYIEPGSDAIKLGAMTDDRVVEVNGVHLTPNNYQKLSAMFEMPLGSKITYTLQRGKKKITVALPLKDLI